MGRGCYKAVLFSSWLHAGLAQLSATENTKLLNELDSFIWQNVVIVKYSNIELGLTGTTTEFIALDSFQLEQMKSKD